MSKLALAVALAVSPLMQVGDSGQSVGPLVLDAVCSPTVVGLADTFEVRITVTGPKRAQSQWPEKLERLADMPVLQVRREGPDEMVGQFGTLSIQRWIARVEPTRLGTVELGSIAFRYRENADGVWIDGAVALPKVEVVATSPGSDDLSTLRGLPDPFASQTSALTPTVLRGLGIAILAIVAGGVIWDRLRSQRKRNANADFLLGLAELEAKLGRTAPREILHMATDRLRGYLEQSLALPASRQTSHEILEDSRVKVTLSAEAQQVLTEYFSRTDVGRFADGAPQVADAEEALRLARRFASLAHNVLQK